MEKTHGRVQMCAEHAQRSSSSLPRKRCPFAVPVHCRLSFRVCVLAGVPRIDTLSLYLPVAVSRLTLLSAEVKSSRQEVICMFFHELIDNADRYVVAI